MLINFLSHAEDDGQPQGGEAKTRASDVLEQYGRDALRLAEKLADVQSDNYRLREERRSLKQSLADAQGKVPGADAVVLTKDEAAALDAYKALGAPDAIKQAMDANGEATAKLAKLEKAERLRAAADAAGFKPAVLERLAADLDIQTETTKEGKPLVYVVVNGEKTALADYAAAEWADFLPALTHAAPQAPDINAGARGERNAPMITDEERAAARRRYSAAF
jgi:hypothetical protein